jgi:thiol-disulfide isomerase/thioredoxin
MRQYLLISLAAIVLASGCTATGNQPDQQAAGPEIGRKAPDFEAMDIGGKVFSRDSLRGKPAMLFFTTTWCTPCQVGAANLARYYDETGGDKFNVAVLFVDEGEDESRLRWWKNRFGREGWFIAYAGGMAESYRVRYLDTKYAIDREGIIHWKNLEPLSYETAKKVMGGLI